MLRDFVAFRETSFPLAIPLLHQWQADCSFYLGLLHCLLLGLASELLCEWMFPLRAIH